MKEKEIIFISSRQKELQQIRVGLKAFLEDDGTFREIFKVVLFENDLVGRRENPQKLYIEWTKKSDVYLGIFDRENSKPVQVEYAQAVKDKIVKKEIILCIRKRREGLRDEMLEEFLKKVKDRHSIIEFEALADLKTKLRRALLSYWRRKHVSYAIGPAYLGFSKKFPKNSNIPEYFRRRLLQSVGRRIKMHGYPIFPTVKSTPLKIASPN